MAKTLVEARNLSKYFNVSSPWGTGRLYLKAVDGVSFNIQAGETLGLVGESGCGKSTLGRLILALLPPTEGEIWLAGENLWSLPARKLRHLRQKAQIIFQDPYSSLNPRMTIRRILEEPFVIHKLGNRRQRREWVEALIGEVGLSVEQLERYPHEFSGGQRQRIGIARALALKPQLIVADEPVSALDVSIQAQILNLLCQLQARFDLTFLFISHDLSVISHISSRIAVMYLGRLVELAAREVFDRRPLHPYTEALLDAIPVPDPNRRLPPPRLQGDPPSPIHLPSGCPFHPRCPYAEACCREIVPDFRETTPGHWVACHFR
ncbi:MAG: ATP-binding cassette domain-containing protein [Deltaproteobacteria bacterium]|nr:ATP-binding cassette domain-containing protein [Deltaproteobacteria bacterium]MBW1953088.1 ATP-binding cassette domain-containing protein [Deltaproteobacteria bacterium]MBW1987185.1 ATP-binding cassette domain-containing protein [Deltaproteobacteria bacterium]MBW2135047.1 ATP-binding cassette domain-containing protein [Deltaproteobacteria bacterium]